MKTKLTSFLLFTFLLCSSNIAFGEDLEQILADEQEIAQINDIVYFEGYAVLTVLSYNPDFSPFAKNKTNLAKQTVGKEYKIQLDYSQEKSIILTFHETEHNKELKIQLNRHDIVFYYQGKEYTVNSLTSYAKAMVDIPYTNYPQRIFALWYNFLNVHDDFSIVAATDLLPIAIKLNDITQAYFMQIEQRLDEGYTSPKPYDIHLTFNEQYQITEYEHIETSVEYEWKGYSLSSVTFKETIGNLKVDYHTGTFIFGDAVHRMESGEEYNKSLKKAKNASPLVQSEVSSLANLVLLLEQYDDNQDGIKKIKRLIADDGINSTALIEAIGYDYPEIVSALLALGADPNQKNVYGYFPLYTASVNGQTAIVNALIEAGANIHTLASDGESVLNTAMDYPDTAIALLLHGADPNIGYDATFPLHKAVEAENEELVEMLIKYNAYLDLEDGEENTPLAIAIRKSNFRIMNMLVKAGADVHVPSQNYLLLAYDDYDSFYPEGVRILCNAGINTYVTYYDGRDILDVAKEDNNYSFVHVVAEARKNSYKAHILDFAAKNNEIYLDYELSKGIDINTRDEGTGLTAVAIAAKYGHFELVHYLVEKGADINIASFEGETALWFAAKLGLINDVKYLIEQGANLEIVGNSNINAIEIAAQNGNLEIVEFLLSKSNKDINTFADVYLLAATNGHLDIVKSMLNKGMNINIQDSEYGFTALMLASLNNHSNIASYLLENNADMQIKNKKNESIFDLSKYISPSMLEYLNSKK